MWRSACPRPAPPAPARAPRQRAGDRSVSALRLPDRLGAGCLRAHEHRPLMASSIAAVAYTDAQGAEWDAFVRKRARRSFERADMDCHSDRFPDASLPLCDGGQLVALSPHRGLRPCRPSAPSPRREQDVLARPRQRAAAALRRLRRRRSSLNAPAALKRGRGSARASAPSCDVKCPAPAVLRPLRRPRVTPGHQSKHAP